MKEASPSGEHLEQHNAPETSYTRREINGHWVEYTFNKDGEERRVAFPRVPIISDALIAEKDQEAQAAASAELLDPAR